VSTVDKAMLLAGGAVIMSEVVYGLYEGLPIETIAALVVATALGIALGFVISRL
jgi:hypothetical protein